MFITLNQAHNYASALVGSHISFWNFKALTVSKQDLSCMCVCSVMSNPMATQTAVSTGIPRQGYWSEHPLLQRIFHPRDGTQPPVSSLARQVPCPAPGKPLCSCSHLRSVGCCQGELPGLWGSGDVGDSQVPSLKVLAPPPRSMKMALQ